MRIRKEVLAGMALMDDDRPGWWQRTNLETLDQGSVVT